MNKKLIYKTITLLAMVFSFHLLSNVSIKDGQWVRMKGKVGQIREDSFVLRAEDTQSGNIIVELDDWSNNSEASKIFPGETAVVYGKFDRDFMELGKIEASSVYIVDRDKTYYGNPTDEEQSGYSKYNMDFYSSQDKALKFSATYNGIVKEIKGKKFVLDTDNQLLTIDTDSLNFNPLDKMGLVKLKAGDKVMVHGKTDLENTKHNELDAKWLVITSQNTVNQSKGK